MRWKSNQDIWHLLFHRIWKNTFFTPLFTFKKISVYEISYSSHGLISYVLIEQKDVEKQIVSNVNGNLKIILMHPWLKCYQLQFNFPIQGLLTKKTRLGMETSIPSWDFQYKKFHKYEVSCLFIKYLLTCGFVTIDGTENLC